MKKSIKLFISFLFIGIILILASPENANAKIINQRSAFNNYDTTLKKWNKKKEYKKNISTFGKKVKVVGNVQEVGDTYKGKRIIVVKTKSKNYILNLKPKQAKRFDKDGNWKVIVFGTISANLSATPSLKNNNDLVTLDDDTKINQIDIKKVFIEKK